MTFRLILRWASHPRQNETLKKREAMLANPGVNPFIDPTEWQRICGYADRRVQSLYGNGKLKRRRHYDDANDPDGRNSAGRHLYVSFMPQISRQRQSSLLSRCGGGLIGTVQFKSIFTYYAGTSIVLMVGMMIVGGGMFPHRLCRLDGKLHRQADRQRRTQPPDHCHPRRRHHVLGVQRLGLC